MKKVKVKKTYEGCVSVRDYIVQEAINNKQFLTICYNGQEMVLSPDQLKSKGKKADVVAHSAWGRKAYGLIDFKWQPNVPSLF